FADILQDIMLNIPDLRFPRGVNEKKIIRNSIAGQEYMVKGFFAGCFVRECDIARLVVESAVHDQTVRNIFSQEVLERQVNTEHVFTEAAAGPGIADACRRDNKLVSSRKETVAFSKRLIVVPAA